MGVAGDDRFLIDITDKQHGFCAQQMKRLEQRHIARLDRHRARRHALAQCLEHALDKRQFQFRFAVAAARPPGRRLEASLHDFEIGEKQFRIDGLDVAQGVDRALHMGDVAVIEAADHMDDGVDFADMAEEFVAQALAAARPAHQPGDVDKFDLRGGHLRRMLDFRQRRQALVRHRNAGHIGLDGAKGIVLGRRLCGRGQAIKQGRFPDIRQADDTATESHVIRTPV